MQITKDISDRIVVLRFPLIFGIVVIHSAFPFLGDLSQYRSSGISPFVLYFENQFSWVFGRACLPLLFVIAGFLLFTSYELSFKCVNKKVRRRINSLFVPYITWNSFACLGIFAIQTFKPALSPYFNPDRTFIANYNVVDFLNGYIGIRDDYVYNEPLWFMRDLILMSLLSPLFWLVLKKTHLIICLIVLTGIWFFMPNLGPLKSGHGLYALIFFTLGASISIKPCNLTWIDKYGKTILFSYVCLAFLEAVTRTMGIYSWQVHRMNLIAGIISLWYLAGIVTRTPKVCRGLVYLSGFSFLIYVSHKPFLLDIVRGTFQVILPSNSLCLIIAYILAPLITVFIILILAIMLSKFQPRFFAAITGQRLLCLT
ncbi:MAG: acyltransferase [Planctomycetes bacterium]|nr:acyltransferase [Planctomycetota bacterium]